MNYEYIGLVIYLSVGGGGEQPGGAASGGEVVNPTCLRRLEASRHLGRQIDGDGGVGYLAPQMWEAWSACCLHGAPRDAARLGASEPPTAPVFCNKCNPSHSP